MNFFFFLFWRFTIETEGDLITIHYLQPRILCTLKNLNRYVINIVFNQIVFASKEVICESNASKLVITHINDVIIVVIKEVVQNSPLE